MSLAEAFATRRFAVTAELSPPRSADPHGLAGKAEVLHGWVDAVNLTDNQGANVRMSSLAGSVLVLRAGVEPIMQVTTRDRNRMALQSDLLAAGALGVPNVLLLTGDHPQAGDHVDAKPVFDVDSVRLVEIARALRDEKRLMNGKRVDPPPRFLIGVVDTPVAPPAGAARLRAKAEAGAEFVQTQYVFDVPRFAEWMADVRRLGLHERCRILAGVGPVRSPRALEHLRTKVPGVHVPDSTVQRLTSAREDGFEEEGLRLAAETVRAVREIPGVAGVHLMAPGNEEAVPEIVARAGLRERAGDRAR
jgi:methylenetetrahydrofolate reductase (NADPH)